MLPNVPYPILRSRSVFAALFVLVGLLLAASSADASVPDDISSCQTETERAPQEVVIPTRVFRGGPVGITIVEGETLCLAGQVEEDGHVSKTWLADSAQNEPVLVVVRLDPPGPMRELHVRSSSERWLSFDVAWVDDAGGARPMTHLHVPPGGRYFPAPDAVVHELLLDELQFYAPALASATQRASSPPPGLARRAAEGDLVVLAGMRLFRTLRGVDERLHASGYSAFSAVAPSFGGSLDFAFARWRFELMGIDSWTRATGPLGSIHADAFELRVSAGYDFLRWRGFTGFGLLGIGGSTFSMDEHGPNWNYLGSRAAVLGSPDRIMRDAGLLTLEAGFEHLVPLVPFGRMDGSNLGLLISLQGGYTHQLGLGDWFASGGGKANVAGSGDFDLSGTWLTLGVGAGAF
jgi:hypothetical protein